MTAPAWRRGVLFGALLVLGAGYIAAYALFVTHSENFIVVQRNRQATLFSQAHPLLPPATLTFGSSGHDNAYLGNGWIMLRDHHGMWMAANDALVMLATAPRNADRVLSLQTMVATTPQQPRNRVEVSVNGHVLGSWERGGPDGMTPIAVRVPGALVRTGMLRVKIHVDRLASLYRQDVGDSRDGQHVGITAISLDQVDSAPH
ncbi:hypothetical protein [Dyella acidiphila]|uniref:Uncharacterized protein n=1 Tax=Dyella acidiphila TaxID=2775866 RepID=A0ABR9G844_9GAMM|nr:hypothetical protein [Dyella acidiphila]MBE1160215.1 hypothetical protein [Dyella acidiphila]